jgi:hypothetical protein
VGSDIVSALDAALGDLDVVLQALGDCVEGELHAVLLEEAEQPPEARARSIFVLGLAAVVTLVDSRRRSYVFTEAWLRDSISSEDRPVSALGRVSNVQEKKRPEGEEWNEDAAYLFVVDDKGHGDLGLVWPLERQALFPEACEVAFEGVVRMAVVCLGYFGGGFRVVWRRDRV